MLYIFYYVTHYTHTRMLSGLLSVDGWCEIVCVDLDCWRCCRISVILSSVISIFWSDFEFIFDSHHFCIPWIFLGFCPDLIFDFLWISVLLPLPLWEVIRLLLWISVRPIYRSYFGNFSFSEHINHLVKAILVDLFVQVGAVPKTRNPRRNPNFNGVQLFSLRHNRILVKLYSFKSLRDTKRPTTPVKFLQNRIFLKSQVFR